MLTDHAKPALAGFFCLEQRLDRELKKQLKMNDLPRNGGSVKMNPGSLGSEWMTRSELIELMADGQHQLSVKDVELAVKLLIDHMAETLSGGQRIEIRGFGSFSLHYREPRQGRNPRTGDAVALRGKHVPHFKPGKELRDRVNRSIKSGF